MIRNYSGSFYGSLYLLFSSYNINIFCAFVEGDSVSFNFNLCGISKPMINRYFGLGFEVLNNLSIYLWCLYLSPRCKGQLVEDTPAESSKLRVIFKFISVEYHKNLVLPQASLFNLTKNWFNSILYPPPDKSIKDFYFMKRASLFL